MSCGQIALTELGVKIERYYASEVDKQAISQTQLNFPNTIQLGDINRWQEWDIDWSTVDLILAGSPCQGFSLAGKQQGLEDNRSKLFWVFDKIRKRVLDENPNALFLLENVRMKPEYEQVINDTLGLMPVVINSSLVSAQNRTRLYWSNIRTRREGLFGVLHTDIPLPKDRGIVIRDILDDEVDSKYYLQEKEVNHSLELGSVAIHQRGRGYNKGGMHYSKSPTLTSCSWENNHSVVGVWRTHKADYGFRPTLGDKSPTVPARARNDGSGQVAVSNNSFVRRLTPRECARLQTIPNWYRWSCSDAQAYKMLGNGWTVEIIKHILSFINYEQRTNKQTN